MIMTRGCASRLLVLSANGNLRALLSGLIFAVTAQAALSGALAPLRNSISQLVDGRRRRQRATCWPSPASATGAGWRSAASGWQPRCGIRCAAAGASGNGWAASAPGLMVAAGWWFTASLSADSFEVVPVQGLTFSGPSAEWLMRVLALPSAPAIGFDFGLLPGVFAGSFLGAWLGGELRLEGFKDGYSMRRYIAGAVLMGFGAMLAGGCAVGAGVTGGSIFALTAWLALVGMWSGAGLTDWLLDRRAPAAVAGMAPARAMKSLAP